MDHQIQIILTFRMQSPDWSNNCMTRSVLTEKTYYGDMHIYKCIIFLVPKSQTLNTSLEKNPIQRLKAKTTDVLN